MAIKVIDIGISWSDETTKQDLNQALADGYTVIGKSVYPYDGEVGERWTLYKADNMSADNVTPVAESVAHPEFKYAARNGDYRHAGMGNTEYWDDSRSWTVCRQVIDGSYESNPNAMRDLLPCPDCLKAVETTKQYSILPANDGNGYDVVDIANEGTYFRNLPKDKAQAQADYMNGKTATNSTTDSTEYRVEYDARTGKHFVMGNKGVLMITDGMGVAKFVSELLNTETKLLREQLASAQAEIARLHSEGESITLQWNEQLETANERIAELEADNSKWIDHVANEQTKNQKLSRIIDDAIDSLNISDDVFSRVARSKTALSILVKASDNA